MTNSFDSNGEDQELFFYSFHDLKSLLRNQICQQIRHSEIDRNTNESSIRTFINAKAEEARLGFVQTSYLSKRFSHTQLEFSSPMGEFSY